MPRDVQVVRVPDDGRGIARPPSSQRAAPPCRVIGSRECRCVPCQTRSRTEAPSRRLQPTLGVAKSGTDRLDQAPETAGVVLLLDVHQLVEQHVVADVRRHLHEPEIEGDVAVARARSPARALIAYRDGADLEAVLDRELAQARQEDGPGQLAQVVLDRRPDVARDRQRGPCDRRRRHARRCPVLRSRCAPARRAAESCCRACQSGPPDDALSTRTRLRSRAIHFSCRRTNCSASRREPPRGTVTRSVPSGRTRRM